MLLLCTSSVTAQKVLPAESLQRLDSLITALDYVIEPEFEHNYILRYDAEGGHVALLREKFYVGTINKTPDQYYKWFKLSDIDPETMEILEDEEGIGLQFFTANNTRTIINSIYVEEELRMHSGSDRLLMGYWHTDADRDLLVNIKDELFSLTLQVWDGNKPSFETDVQKPAALFINGEEIIWQETTEPGDAEEE